MTSPAVTATEFAVSEHVTGPAVLPRDPVHVSVVLAPFTLSVAVTVAFGLPVMTLTLA